MSPLWFGLVGLAALGDSGSAIRELTAKIEQFEAGEDVTFSTDREGTVGDLYDAVSRLASSAQFEESKRERGERYRRRLYDSTTNSDLDDDEKLERVLELGCERLGVENGHLVEVDQATNTHEIRMAVGSDIVQTGAVTALDKTYCQETITEDDILCVSDALADGYGDHPGYLEWDIGCYIGGKIEADGEVRGTVCFVRQDPRAEPFSHGERVFVDLVARWVSSVYERRESTERLQTEHDRFEALFENSTNAIAHVELDDDAVTVRSVNPQFTETFGYDAEEVVGEQLLEYVVPSDQQEELNRLIEKARQGEHVRQEVVRETASGNREFLAEFVPVGDDYSPTEGYAVYTDITEQKERERALAESEARYRAIAESANDAIVTIDTDHIVQFANPAVEDIFGYTPKALVGEPLTKLMPERLRERARTALEQFQETRERTIDWSDKEFSGLRKDGEEIDLSIAFSENERHGELQLEGVIRDVTDRKKHQREIQETKERLELALKGSNTGTWEWNLDTGTVRFDETAEQMLGFEAGGFEGTYEAFERRIHPDDVSIIDTAVEQARETDGLYQAEFRVEHVDGSWLWLEARGRLRTDEDGTERMVGINHDVTARKESERQLQRYKEYTDELLETLDDLFYVIGPDRTFRRWNQSLVDATGYADEEVASMGPLEFVAEGDEAKIATAIEEAFESGSTRAEARLQTKSGELIPYDFNGAALENPDGETVLVGVGRDISEQKERQRELERTQDLLQQAQSMAKVGGWAVDTRADSERGMWTDEVYRIYELPVDSDINPLDGIEFYHPNDRRRIRSAVDRALEQGKSYDLEARLVTAEDNEKWIRTIGTPVTADGEVVAVRGSIQDITEQKERERELREMEAKYRSITEDALGGSEVGMFILDSDYEIVWCNEAIEDTFGVQREAIVGRNKREVLTEQVAPAVDDSERFREKILESYEDNTHSEQFECHVLPGENRQEKWLEHRSNPIESGLYQGGRVEHYTDITERTERQRELERTRDMLQQAQSMAKVGGWELDAQSDPPELTATDQARRIYELECEDEKSLADAFEYIHPADTQRVREALDRALEDGDPYDIEVRLLTAKDNRKWVRAIAVPIVEEGEVVAVRGSLQDITEQKEREQALESLHETTRDLLGAETNTDAAERVVESAEDVLDIDGTALYLLDEASNELDAVACSGRLCDCDTGTPSVAAGVDSPLWDCFVTGEQFSFDGTETAGLDELFDDDIDSGLVVPIGDHGVFVTVTTESAVDDATKRLIETLVATAAAAFDRIERDASLRKRDEELEAQNQQLRRQIQITDIIRGIDQSLISATSREEIQSAVCTQLVEAEDITFAWIGSTDVPDETLTPSTLAGSGKEYLDGVSLALDDDSPEPSVATAVSGEPTVVGNVLQNMKESPWRKEALAHKHHSVVSVPLTFEEYSYGVLTVYAARPDTFDDLERSVFAELGGNIAHSINAVETQQALHTDTQVELRLELDPSEHFFGRLAAEADCTVTCQGLATHTDDQARVFVTATDASRERVTSALDGLLTVEEYRVVTERDSGELLFEVVVTGESLPGRVVRHGGRPQSITATATEMGAVVDVPAATDVREFVGMLRSAFPSVELLGRKTVQRTAHTRQELIATLLDGLTDRQQEVLRTAYYAGFFEWPRASTGQDVAEMLDISQPTVNRHLRIAQQRLLAQLFDRDVAGQTAGGTA